jgi:tetratricopeptide (TPR) repeat protein|tara:strand:+ start:60 stop:692 length:633 start_codon:yes stop_codon:yes gene_type:complete
MKFYLFVILFSVLISCKSENNSKEKDSLESNKRNIDLYITGEKFETKKADKLNLEGIELSKKSEYKKAEKIFLNALEIEPNNPTILNNLGNVKDYQNKYEESIKYYEKSLLVSDSLYLNAGLNIGVISYKTKNYNKSLNLLEYVISKSNDLKLTEIANYYLILIYIRQNKCEKAKAELKKFEQIFKNNFQFVEQYEYLKSEIKNCVQHRI